MKCRGGCIAIISSAFPGLFSYHDFELLDERDFVYWFRQALIQRLDHLEAGVVAARSGMAMDAQPLLSEIERQRGLIRSGKTYEEVVQQNWEDLKMDFLQRKE